MNSSKRRTGIILQVVLILAICLALGIAAWVFKIFAPPAGSHTVTMRIESTGGSALVSYQTVRDGPKQSLTVSTPWEQSFTLPAGNEVFLTAGTPSQTGTISCFIKLDGGAWKNNTAEAPADQVACAGIVP